MRWNLDTLYTSFDSEEFKNHYEILGKEIELTEAWCNNNLNNSDKPIEKLKYFINKQNEVLDLYWKLYSFSLLTFRANTKNQMAIESLNNLEQKNSEFLISITAFKKWVGTLENLNDLISQSELLQNHRFYLTNIEEKNKYSLSVKEEGIISKMQITGSSAWAKLRQQLTSSLLVEMNIEGENKKLPFSASFKFLSDKNKEMRKNAFEERIKAYETIEDSASACLNGVKGEFLTTSKLRGYESPLHQILMNSRMDMESLEAMNKAVEESLPILRKYLKKKAELLSHNNGLPQYDRLAPIGNVDMKFSFDEAKEFVINSFKNYSSKLANFAQRAFEEKWIDAEPRLNKVGGGSCISMTWFKESRILVNFNGSYRDVLTIAHEIGHGYHGSCLNNETHLNCWYTAPIGETASIFCESIVQNELLKKTSENETLPMLEVSLRDTAWLVLNQYSNFIFEKEFYRRREKGSLSVKEIKELVVESNKQVLGDVLDYESINIYNWMIPHYYMPKYHFYNFPYIFGLLFSKGLYAEYLKRGEGFIENFDKMLAATGKMNNTDLAMLMGIDLHSIDFWRSSLKSIEEDVERFVAL